MPPPPFELLNFVIVTLARKPPVLQLRDGAAVARYLDCLVDQLPPGEQRQDIFRLSKAIWGRVLQFSKFKTAGKEEAIQFLEKFAPTHLATFDAAAAVKTVRESPIPKPHVLPSVLRAPGTSATLSQGHKNFSDDLTERICAGYWALRFGSVRGARNHVAAALNHHRIQTRSRTDVATWTGAEVEERTKQYEARTFPKDPQQMPATREALVRRWQALYYPVEWAYTPYTPAIRTDLKSAKRPPKLRAPY